MSLYQLQTILSDLQSVVSNIQNLISEQTPETVSADDVINAKTPPPTPTPTPTPTPEPSPEPSPTPSPEPVGPFFNTETFNKLEAEVLETISTYKGINDLWKSLDFNGNNIVSLAEIDKFVIGNYPLLNNKPALMRAYKRTTLKDGDGDCWVEKKEFRAMLYNLFYFNKVFQAFQLMDADNDRRLNLEEFQSSCDVLSMNMNADQLTDQFNAVDTNGGGIVLFDEFCAWYVQHNEPETPSDFGRE